MQMLRIFSRPPSSFAGVEGAHIVQTFMKGVNMELGTGCSYVARKDYAQLECDNALSRTGLGLEIARSLLERMHGSISTEYAQNRLCIYIRLPNTAEKTHTM